MLHKEYRWASVVVGEGMELDTLEPDMPSNAGQYKDYAPQARPHPFDSGSVVMPDHSPRRPSYTDQIDPWHVLRRIITLLLFCIGLSATITYFLSRGGENEVGVAAKAPTQEVGTIVAARSAPVVVPDFSQERTAIEDALEGRKSSTGSAPLEHVAAQPVKIEKRRFLYSSDSYREFGSTFSEETRTVDMKMDRSLNLNPVPGNSGRYADSAGGVEWQGGFSLDNPDANLRLGRSYTEYLNSMMGGLPGGNLNVAPAGRGSKVLPSAQGAPNRELKR